MGISVGGGSHRARTGGGGGGRGRGGAYEDPLRFRVLVEGFFPEAGIPIGVPLIFSFGSSSNLAQAFCPKACVSSTGPFVTSRQRIWSSLRIDRPLIGDIHRALAQGPRLKAVGSKEPLLRGSDGSRACYSNPAPSKRCIQAPSLACYSSPAPSVLLKPRTERVIQAPSRACWSCAISNVLRKLRSERATPVPSIAR